MFKPKDNIINQLIKNSPEHKQGGIYQVPCMDCRKLYIGQTGRPLDTRLKEHKRAVREADERNAIFTHVQNFHHRINWTQSKIIINCKDYLKRNYIESAIIQRNETNLINNSHGLYKIDSLTLSNIVKNEL